MALTFRPRRGRPPLPRVELQQYFLDRLSQQSGWQLSRVAGFPHYTAFSAFLHRRDIPAAPVTIERFYRLADALNFPRADVFRAVTR